MEFQAKYWLEVAEEIQMQKWYQERQNQAFEKEYSDAQLELLSEGMKNRALD